MNRKEIADTLKAAMPYYAPFCFEFPDKDLGIYSYRMCDTLAYMVKDSLLEKEKANNAILAIKKRLWPDSSIMEYLIRTGKLHRENKFASTDYDKKALQFWAYHIARITEAPLSILGRLRLALYSQNLNLWDAEDILSILEI